MEGVDLGGGWEPDKGTGRNEVLKNKLAGLFYFIWFGVCFTFSLIGRKWKDGERWHQGGWKGLTWAVAWEV